MRIQRYFLQYYQMQVELVALCQPPGQKPDIFFQPSNEIWFLSGNRGSGIESPVSNRQLHRVLERHETLLVRGWTAGLHSFKKPKQVPSVSLWNLFFQLHSVMFLRKIKHTLILVGIPSTFILSVCVSGHNCSGLREIAALMEGQESVPL